MNGIDVGICIVLFLSSLIGLIRGITREILSLASWSGATLLTIVTLPFFQYIARQHIANQTIADALTGFILFIIFLIILSLVSHFFSSIIRQSALGGIDCSLGFTFGVFRGFTIVCILQLIIDCFMVPANQPAALQNNRFSSIIRQGSSFIQKIVPPNFQKYIMSSSNDIHLNATNNIVQNIITQVDPQKIAEELAHLKPKTNNTSSSEVAYSNKQKRQMERLLDLEEDEEDKEQAAVN